MEQFSFFNNREISFPQQQVFNELESSLNNIVKAELNKYLMKITESTVIFCNNRMGLWKNHITHLEHKLTQADKLLTEGEELINLHEIEKNDLQRQLNNYSAKIKNQRKNIVQQQNALIEKSKYIKTLEANYNALVLSVKEQNKKIIAQDEDTKVYKKATTDLTLEIAEVRRQNDHWISESRRLSEKNDSLHIELQKQATEHQSKLYDSAKRIERLKNELAAIKSKLEHVKLQPQKMKVPAASCVLDKQDLKLLLDEKESKIQEYLKIINEKDGQILSQKPCCPVCLTDLDRNQEMIVFYPCGHQSCSECFGELPWTN